MRLAYLLAASHSGSTLTAFLLSSHPEIASVGELKATYIAPVDAYLCSCHERIIDCDFWSRIESRMHAEIPGYTITDSQTDLQTQARPFASKLLRPLHRGPALELVRDLGLTVSPGWSALRRNFAKRNVALVRAIQAETGASVIADSSKSALRLKYLLKIPELDIRVIWLVRDGRGVSLAYRDPALFADAKDPSVRGGGAGRAYEAGRDVPHGALEWTRCIEEQQHVLATMDQDRWLNVRYEDLCANPTAELGRIHAFLDLAPAEAQLKSRPHHVIGNGMRLDTTTEVSLDERWRESLSAEALTTFERIAGPLNRSLGYD